jgi:DNA-binding Lrp family transcriptional regulator
VSAPRGYRPRSDVSGRRGRGRPGPYDIIVRAEARNVDDLGKLVVAKIQAVEGITRTLICPVVHL